MGMELLQDEQMAGGRGDAKTRQSSAEYCHELTTDIMENVKVAISILNDLLNYDKIETGQFRLEVEPVGIWQLVTAVTNGFQIEATKKNLMLSLINSGAENDVEKNAVNNNRSFVLGDNTRIRQILRNLLSNCIKFSKEGRSIIVAVTHIPDGLPKSQALSLDDVRKTQHYTRAGSVRISVKDEGIGLTREQLAMLFNEGVQFDVNRLQNGGGSGLGLHISKGLAEQHGGTIFAESDGVGFGCTFTLELPLFDYDGPMEEFVGALPEPDEVSNQSASSAPEQASTSVSSDQRTGTTVSRPRKVLVVEDVASNRKLLLRLLERAGHACAAAENGQEAIDMYFDDLESGKGEEGHEAFDTILMDYEMPVLNGPDASKKLRDRGCNAFIVGVTGNMLADDVAYFESMGCDRVMAKPVKIQVLKDLWAQYDEQQKS